MSDKRLTEQQFNDLIYLTKFHKRTIKVLKKVLLEGLPYSKVADDNGMSKQFLYAKLKRLEEIDRAYGYGYMS